MNMLNMKNQKTDVIFLGLMAGCSLFSVVLLFSWCYGMAPEPVDDFIGFLAVYRVALTQLGAVILGMLSSVILARIDYHHLSRFWIVYNGVVWGLVLLTFLRIGPFGTSPGDTGAYCWIQLPLGFALQPSEFAKVGFIITFALHLHAAKSGHLRFILPGLLLHLMIPVLLVHFQGDDGTALIFFAIGTIMLLSVYHKPRHLIAAGLTLGALIPILWSLLAGYQKNRILAVFAPDKLDADILGTILYQQNQGLAAIKSGGVFGNGLFSSNTTYIPAANNDFIFSYLADTLGVIGCIAVLLLIVVILYRTLYIGLKCHNSIGRAICIGVFTLFLFQTVINIGMNLRLMPVIGIPLPFFSSGGSSLMAVFLCAGLVLGVKRNSPDDQDCWRC